MRTLKMIRKLAWLLTNMLVYTMVVSVFTMGLIFLMFFLSDILQ